MSLYREDLDALGGCSVPGCRADHEGDQDVYFHARCHPQSATWAHYRDGTLTIECARCGSPVVAVFVAGSPRGGGGRSAPDEEAVP